MMTIDGTPLHDGPHAPACVEVHARSVDSPSVLRVATRLSTSLQAPLKVCVVAQPGAAKDDDDAAESGGDTPTVLVLDGSSGSQIISMLCVAPDKATTEGGDRLPAIPVVSIAPAADNEDPLQTTVVATDFSVASWDAAEIAFRAMPQNTTVHVVHVLHDGGVGTTAWRHAVEAAVSAWCAPLGALLPAGTGVRIAVLSGDPTAALRSYLSGVHATCIAVGGHRRRRNSVTVSGYTLPEQILATWQRSAIVAPYRGP